MTTVIELGSKILESSGAGWREGAILLEDEVRYLCTRARTPARGARHAHSILMLSHAPAGLIAMVESAQSTIEFSIFFSNADLRKAAF